MAQVETKQNRIQTYTTNFKGTMMLFDHNKCFTSSTIASLTVNSHMLIQQSNKEELILTVKRRLHNRTSLTEKTKEIELERYKQIHVHYIILTQREKQE